MDYIGVCKDYRRSGVSKILSGDTALICGRFDPGRKDDPRSCMNCRALEWSSDYSSTRKHKNPKRGGWSG